MFHIATEDEIKSGKVTDVYFQRTLEILKHRGINKRVVMEIGTKGLPHDWNWAVLSGIEECIELLRDEPVSLIGLREGTAFHSYEPVLEVEGYYQDIALRETAILGFLCQSSGVATAAARCRKAAETRPVISFGARRMHPAIGPMIERSAFIGGCDGVAGVKSAECIGEQPAGTMPHALILIMGDTVEATKAFHEIIPENVLRVSLIDTFHDEKFAALEVAESLGNHLYAVRLDTPSSRRGDFLRIIEEVRWELNLRGFQEVKIFVSGNIDVAAIQNLNMLVDAYGVGTYVSNAPVVDFSMDIVEIEGEPIAKRGKLSGRKKLYRCPACYRTTLRPREDSQPTCSCGGSMECLTVPLITDGNVAVALPRPQEIREYVLEQLPFFAL